ncbi:MAG: L,D-transpeptidase, partial [Anaerolineaceae bacterium]|nr:L,D-transpeptidase [Anaerolineaceae bacterium]
FKVGIPYWKIQEANPGTSIIGIGPGQELTIPSKNDLLPLPVVPGKRVVISISEQHMWIYENRELRSEHVISTGIDRSPTLPGFFQIQTHEINAYASNWDLWMPNFLGIYEAVPGFMNGIHGLPLLSSGVRLWGNVLGSKASYGCIIMTLDAAEDLYNWAENGVVVEILP